MKEQERRRFMRTAVFYRKNESKASFGLTMESEADIWVLIDRYDMQCEYTMALLPVKK